MVGGADLLVGVGGDADDAIRADDAAGVFGREIALADVDAVEVGEDGEVGAVVQDETAGAAGECFAQDCGGAQDILRRAVFIAILHQGDAGGAEFAGKGGERDAARGEEFCVEDGVEVRENHANA